MQTTASAHTICACWWRFLFKGSGLFMRAEAPGMLPGSIDLSSLFLLGLTDQLHAKAF